LWLTKSLACVVENFLPGPVLCYKQFIKDDVSNGQSKEPAVKIFEGGN